MFNKFKNLSPEQTAALIAASATAVWALGYLIRAIKK